MVEVVGDPEKRPQEDPLVFMRNLVVLNLIITLILAAALYVHLTATAEPGGFYVRPVLSENEILRLLRENNISGFGSDQGRAFASAVNDAIGAAVERSPAGGTVTITTSGTVTTGTGENGSTGAAGATGEPGTPGEPGRAGEPGTAGETPAVTITVDGRNITIFVSPACCGGCNATTTENPSCPPPAPSCQAYGSSCVNNSECCTGYSCVNGECGFPPPNNTPTPSPTPPPPPTCQGYSETCLNSSECCTGYSCVNGQCGFPPGNSTPNNTTPPPNGTPACETSGPCTFSSECCSSYACIGGYCQPEPTCQATGQACSSNSQCCSGLACDNSTRTCRPPPSCSPQNDYCVSTSDCCANLQCINSACTSPSPQPTPTPTPAPSPNPSPSPPPSGQQLCSETDNGADYYKKGTTTGSLSGTWGSYTDYCDTPNHITEYYCEVIYGYNASGYPTTTYTSNALSSGLNCAHGCSNGQCNP